jgi:hypothetical protein
MHLNVVFDICLAFHCDVSPFLDLNVNALEAEVLAMLLQAIMLGCRPKHHTLPPSAHDVLSLLCNAKQPSDGSNGCIANRLIYGWFRLNFKRF